MRRSVLVGLAAILALTTVSLGVGSPAETIVDGLTAASEDRVRVIVRTARPAAAERLIRTLGGRTLRRLTSVPSVVAEVGPATLQALAVAAFVDGVHVDRPLHGTLARTVGAIGAKWVHESLGFDGSGVGVAIIDSGVTRHHDDLTTRVAHFADLVDSASEPYDGYGHGTHVAGIIAGNGHSSAGRRRGVAPGAHLVVLKALDHRGGGFISNAIAALDYAIEQRAAYNIRVINLSVAAGVYESYRTDPLTLAARRAVEAGIVVVTAAGNLGRSSSGRVQYGGITAPGNAPWVLTVGAANHNGTVDRSDDVVAPFSSLGPSAIDFVAKPDLVAPGVGIESAADPGSTLFNGKAGAPYVSLSGTSMAAPFVTGTVALMLQANPGLTPAAVRAVLQRSAAVSPGESHLAQGAGFLDTRAAVELARTVAETPAAAELLDELVSAYAPEEGAWMVPCAPGEPACRYLTACPATPVCFDEMPWVVTGAVAPDEGATAWQRKRRSTVSTKGNPRISR